MLLVTRQKINWMFEMPASPHVSRSSQSQSPGTDLATKAQGNFQPSDH